MKRITGHLAEKKNKWYAVINLYDVNGKRKEKWDNLDLATGRGTKKEATYRLNQLLDKYNSDDIYLQGTMSHAERERSRVANMQVVDYLPEWLESHKPNISDITYKGYRTMIESSMAPYFKTLGDLKVKDITGDEINDYYLHICILLAVYGLRRSEVLGLKWDAIDFQKNTITIKHTITSCKIDGKKVEVASDTTKTKSSRRTLPLIPQFREMLLQRWEMQEGYKRVCGNCYNTK